MASALNSDPMSGLKEFSMVRGKEPLSETVRQALYHRMRRTMPASVAGREIEEMTDDELLKQPFHANNKFISSDNKSTYPNLYQYLSARIREVDPDLAPTIFGEDHALYGKNRYIDHRRLIPESYFTQSVANIGRFFVGGLVMGTSITWLVTLYGMSQNPSIRGTRAKFTFANYYALKIGMRTSTMAALTVIPFSVISDVIIPNFGYDTINIYLLSPFFGTYLTKKILRVYPGHIQNALPLHAGCTVLIMTALILGMGIGDPHGFEISSGTFPVRLFTAPWAMVRKWKTPDPPSPYPEV